MSAVELLEICIYPNQYERNRCAEELLLDNIGNTCYINVVLQLLFHNDEFRQHVCDYKSEGEGEGEGEGHKFLLFLKGIFRSGRLGYTGDNLKAFLQNFRDLCNTNVLFEPEAHQDG